jgi:hypothetical protein
VAHIKQVEEEEGEQEQEQEKEKKYQWQDKNRMRLLGQVFWVTFSKRHPTTLCLSKLYLSLLPCRQCDLGYIVRTQ